MADAEINKHYYSITTANHCACGFLQDKAGIGTILTDLLEDCTYYGEVVLFFYWDDGDYHLFENDVYSYIKKAKNVRLCFKDFLDAFISQKFKVDDVVYIIKKTVVHDG